MKIEDTKDKENINLENQATNAFHLNMKWVKNNETIHLTDLPIVKYSIFQETVLSLLADANCHCVNYFVFPQANKLQFIACIANDVSHEIGLLSHELDKEENWELESMTAQHYALHVFEREICENYGVNFKNHPWLKPLRFAHNRANRGMKINDYPFYKIGGNELHEVGVGPIHAGVIEPGHFRFLCNGEMVLHLEIQLGWQHRGVERAFLEKKKLLQRNILAESIAGDTAVGHNLAFCNLMESLANQEVSKRLQIERAMALELERMAIHTGDIGTQCIGIAFQLGTAMLGVLRTPLINYTQLWCGNRFGKSLIRVGGTNYPFTPELGDKLDTLLLDFEKKFSAITDHTFRLPSVIMRWDDIGKLSPRQMELLGGVGMVARSTNIKRDIRQSHPYNAYQFINHRPVVIEGGDVRAREMIRKLEVEQSIKMIKEWRKQLLEISELPAKPLKDKDLNLQAESFCISLVEGWRGEICHCAITDEKGEIVHYKVKDPSLHNWMALALALRNLEISDFPINNKSFNLSYCGHDL